MPMIAFEIQLNNQKLCRAGIGDSGVLSAIVTRAATTTATGTRNESLFLDVGGLITPEGKHVSWINQKTLVVGDEIQISIVEAGSVDEHRRRDPAEDGKLRRPREDRVRACE